MAFFFLSPFPHFSSHTALKTLHKKWSFPLRISSVNANKYALRIRSHLPKKSSMVNFIFFAVFYVFFLFLNWLSLKRGFGGCVHGFSGCARLGGLGGFDGLDGFGGFNGFNGYPMLSLKGFSVSSTLLLKILYLLVNCPLSYTWLKCEPKISIRKQRFIRRYLQYEVLGDWVI